MGSCTCIFDEVHLSLGGEPASVPRARRAVQGWLSERGVPPAAIDRVSLVLTELVDNAVRHAGTDLDVRAVMDGDGVRVEVTDRDARMPVAGRPGPAAASGRGLWLVSQIADRWGTEPLDSGKVVWAALAPDGSTKAAWSASRRRPAADEAVDGVDHPTFDRLRSWMPFAPSV